MTYTCALIIALHASSRLIVLKWKTTTDMSCCYQVRRTNSWFQKPPKITPEMGNEIFPQLWWQTSLEISLANPAAHVTSVLPLALGSFFLAQCRPERITCGIRILLVFVCHPTSICMYLLLEHHPRKMRSNNDQTCFVSTYCQYLPQLRGFLTYHDMANQCISYTCVYRT